MKPLDLTPEQIADAFPGAPLANIKAHWPHVRNALLDARLAKAKALEATMAPKTVAQKSDAEKSGVQKSGQRSGLALFQRLDQPGRRLITHALQTRQRRRVERVQVSGIAHPIPFHQLIHQLVAQSSDIQRTARGEMANRFLALGAAA